MSGSDSIDSGVVLPRMADAQPLPGFVLRVTWSDGRRAGREDAVDLRPVIDSYKIFRPLRDEAFFLTGQLGDDGEAVIWSGDDLEISADMVLSLAEEAMAPSDFADFLVRNELTQQAAASLLGRSRRQIANYIATGPIPRIVALACYGYEARKRDVSIARQLQSAASSMKEPESRSAKRA
jgi:hypothetical protein